jgi:hypothetical protein
VPLPAARRGDGKEISYNSSSGMLMAVPVNGESVFTTGTPAPLFQIYGRAPISTRRSSLGCEKADGGSTDGIPDV